jgi:hypothetical protein
MNEQTVMTATRNIVKKLTVKTCGAKPDMEKLVEWKKANGPNAIYWLLGIVGIASDFAPGQNAETGTSFVKLFGQFKGTNLLTGEVFVSGAAILPGAASDLIYGALKGRGEGSGSIEFAFRIGVHWDETSATKYVYDVEQTFQPAAADPLAALEQKLLAAPKDVTPPALSAVKGKK